MKSGCDAAIWCRRSAPPTQCRESFEPLRIDNRWLFDGALVNPVPVTLCRAMGAELVIAVNLVGDTAYRGALITDGALPVTEAGEPIDGAAAVAEARQLRRQFGRGADGAPGIAAAMLDAFNITQDRIARSRLAGDPPDVLINARLSKIGLFDFHRADELIAIGREAARRALNEIAEVAAIEAQLHGQAHSA